MSIALKLWGQQRLAYSVCECGKSMLSINVKRMVSFSPRYQAEVDQQEKDDLQPKEEYSDHIPKVLEREISFPNPTRSSIPAWLDTLKTVESTKIGLLDLHPDIWATYPRIDLLHKNVEWQRSFRRISLATTKSPADKRGGGRKPWPQKGLGKARHGSRRSVIWKGGGRSHGPHGPKSYFYMLPLYQRIAGLRSALTIKLAQNDLVIVDDLEIPTNEEEYLETIADRRNWGQSVLLVDNNHIMPENITLATHEKRGFTLMPAYGLNVFSMLKHETLVLTLDAVNQIESRLLMFMNQRHFKEDKYHPGSGFNPSSLNYDRFLK